MTKNIQAPEKSHVIKLPTVTTPPCVLLNKFFVEIIGFFFLQNIRYFIFTSLLE